MSLLATLAAAALLAAPPSTGTIAGTVADPSGQPIANAQVTVEGTAFRALSDPRGRFRIDGVPAGTYALRTAFIGYQRTETRGVIVVGGRVTRVSIVLQPSAVQVEEIVVADPSGRPVARDEAATKQPIRGGPPQAAPAGANAFEQRALKAQGGFATISPGVPADFNTEDYAHRRDNRFLTVSANPLSTFAIDVDAASYANVRRFLVEGRRPPADAVRVEELINYFSYDYPAPRDGAPFAVTTAQMPAPWAPDHQLVLIGVQGREVPVAQLPPSNLVFLIDVSGSMQSPDKLPLVKRAFRLLVEQLRPQDRVAIVVYAGAAGLVLEPTPGSRKAEILAAIDRLEAGGSTAGGAGIQLAYEVARRHHLAEGNNRVILATDGDFNVGASSEGELVRLVEERKRQGTYLTVLGFGTGNLKDSRMEQLANKGNGHYAYVDDILEARKVLVQELGATLLTIAKDVKIQVEFNPAHVAEYRLIGYENRLLAAEDFNDDAKDGGELGAGHRVTALYEVVPAGRRTGASVDPLKYGESRRAGRDAGGELLTVKLRWQHPTAGGPSRLLEAPVRVARTSGEQENLRWAAAVAAFGMLLRDSEFKGSASWPQVRDLARSALGRDAGGYRSEFLRLVDVAASLGGERGEELGAR